MSLGVSSSFCSSLGEKGGRINWFSNSFISIGCFMGHIGDGSTLDGVCSSKVVSSLGEMEDGSNGSPVDSQSIPNFCNSGIWPCLDGSSSVAGTSISTKSDNSTSFAGISYVEEVVAIPLMCCWAKSPTVIIDLVLIIHPSKGFYDAADIDFIAISNKGFNWWT